MKMWYLATVYSKHPGGLDAAYDDACHCAARLIAAGAQVYSPIAHTHGIARAGAMGTDHLTWGTHNERAMGACYGLIVAASDGWQESAGVRAEMTWFEAAGKPIVLWFPEGSIPATLLP